MYQVLKISLIRVKNFRFTMSWKYYLIKIFTTQQIVPEKHSEGSGTTKNSFQN